MTPREPVPETTPRVGRWGTSGGNDHLWYCPCLREHPRYVKSCHECGTVRPPAPSAPVVETGVGESDAWVDTRLVKLDHTVSMSLGYDWGGWESLRKEMHTPHGSFAVWPEKPRGWSLYSPANGMLSVGGYATCEEARLECEMVAGSLAAGAALRSPRPVAGASTTGVMVANGCVVSDAGEAAALYAKLYHELLREVAHKYPNETRHETALRYIRERERGASTLASQATPDAEVRDEH